MNAELRRLCKAASEVELDSEPNWLREEDAERVVRAILIELKSVTSPMVRAMCKSMSLGRRPTPDRVSVKEKHSIRFRAAIDILMEE